MRIPTALAVSPKRRRVDCGQYGETHPVRADGATVAARPNVEAPVSLDSKSPMCRTGTSGAARHQDQANLFQAEPDRVKRYVFPLSFISHSLPLEAVNSTSHSAACSSPLA